jgi:hypothetical protein
MDKGVDVGIAHRRLQHWIVTSQADSLDLTQCDDDRNVFLGFLTGVLLTIVHNFIFLDYDAPLELEVRTMARYHSRFSVYQGEFLTSLLDCLDCTCTDRLSHVAYNGSD